MIYSDSSYLFIRSGSGKSTLVKRKLAQLDSKQAVYLLNVRPDEVEGYRKIHRNTVAVVGVNLADSLSQVKGSSYIIIEDIICVSQKEEESIRMLLNYRAHHDKLRVICIGHMLYRTHLLTLVPLFNYLVFTLVNASRNLLKAAATFGFHLDKEEAAEWLATFSHQCSESNEVGTYMYIDCSNVALHHSTNVEGSASAAKQGERNVALHTQQQKQLQLAPSKGAKRTAVMTRESASTSSAIEAKFANCFAGQSNSGIATAFFSIIVVVLQKQASFRPHDLSLGFTRARLPSKLKRISVVDYTCSLLNERPASPPSTDHLVLHRFLCERCKIPALFIRNPYFWSTTSDVSDDDDDDDDDDADGNNLQNVGAEKKARIGSAR